MPRWSFLNSCAAVGAAVLASLVAVPTPAGATPTCAGHVATIVGTDGDDRIQGTDGADVIVAGDGRDAVSTGDGRDLICGGGGDDEIHAGAGADLLIGGAGNDRLYGGGGRDRLRAGRGLDFLNDGAGDDIARAGADADLFRAAPGDDLLVGDTAGERSPPADQLNFQHQSNGGVSVDLPANRAVGPTTGHDTVRGIADITTTGYADHIVGDDADNVLRAGKGNDVVDGGGGNDLLDGGGFGLLGHDDDILRGEAGDDVIIDDLGVTIDGIGDDRLEGGEGADLLISYGGSNVVDGGPGEDTLSAPAPGENHDWQSVVIDLAAGSAQLFVGTSTLLGIEDVVGSAQGETIRGDDGPNVIYGGYGPDTIEGRGGDDHLFGGPYEAPDSPDNDTVDGGDGVDVCAASSVTNCEA